MHTEYLLKTRNVIFGLSEVELEGLLELRIPRLIDHIRQRLQDLFFRIVDVAQRVHEQIIHGLYVFGEEAHCVRPYDFADGRKVRPGQAGIGAGGATLSMR